MLVRDCYSGNRTFLAITSVVCIAAGTLHGNIMYPLFETLISSQLKSFTRTLIAAAISKILLDVHGDISELHTTDEIILNGGRVKTFKGNGNT